MQKYTVYLENIDGKFWNIEIEATDPEQAHALGSLECKKAQIVYADATIAYQVLDDKGEVI